MEHYESDVACETRSEERTDGLDAEALGLEDGRVLLFGREIPRVDLGGIDPAPSQGCSKSASDADCRAHGVSASTKARGGRRRTHVEEAAELGREPASRLQVRLDPSHNFGRVLLHPMESGIGEGGVERLAF